MNRKPSGLLISKAVEGFGQFKQAEGLSPRTVDGYALLDITDMQHSLFQFSFR